MADRKFQTAGYAVLTEEDPSQTLTLTRKICDTLSYGSKTFTLSQLKRSIYAEDFLAIFLTFEEFGHTISGTSKPIIIMTDSKRVTQFFQAKTIPQPLWIACDFVRQFSFTIAQIRGNMNTAIDFP